MRPVLVVVVDDDRGVSRWLDAARTHAEWLSLRSETLVAKTGAGSSVGVAWSVPDGIPAVRPPRIEQSFVHATTHYHDRRPSLGGKPPAELWRAPGEAGSSDARVLVSLETGELKALVAPTTPSQLVYARVDGGFVITDDIRALVRELGIELDRRAVYALFQHGAIPAPLTIACGVDRVLPGHVMHLTEPTSTPRYAPLLGFGHRAGDETVPFRLEIVRDALDRSLAEVPRGAVLYFSGGVDSGLLAARFADLGRSDVRLVNMSFGADDQEAALARRMATHLGLSLEQVEFRPSAIADVLDRLGREYTFPFGDTSVMPTNVLVHDSLPRARESGIVVDGTGADGLFGMWPKHREWQRVYGVPRSIRRAGSALYRGLRLWRQSGRIERIGRVVRRSSQMRPECAAITAQNALAGIAYRAASEDEADAIERMVLHVPEAVWSDPDGKKRVSTLDLIHVCAGEQAAKSFDPLAMRGVTPTCPFLEPSLVELVLGMEWDESFRRGEPKGQLKALLAASVPDAMVYRPKAQFVADLPRAFAEPAMHEFFSDIVLAREAPLESLFNQTEIESMLKRCREGKELSIGAYDFLWTLGFTSGWLSTFAQTSTRSADG
jgi:asparagine synthase (glutamine-hydrolysing)